MTLNSEIALCQKCIAQEVSGHDKPYVSFSVEKDWKPDEVKVLFVAESPPWSKERYFYKARMNGKQTNLQKELFKYLSLKSLEAFKAKGYFAIDVIKCRLNKTVSDHVPATVLQNCAGQFLRREIASLNPGVIFVLGNSAKLALQQLPEFQKLKMHKVTENYDCMLSGRRVILSVYPGGKTRMHIAEIKRAFSKITKM